MVLAVEWLMLRNRSCSGGFELVFHGFVAARNI